MKVLRTVHVSGQIPQALAAAALRTMLPEAFQGRADVVIRIRVPSGGDYSGRRCDLEDFEFHWSCEYTEESDV